jgi:hypothetical protein
MSAPEKNSPELRDFIQDPDLPLDQAGALSGAEQETALRQRHLDRQLKAAMAEIHSRVDRHQPDGDTFMLRLQNSIEALDRETGATARKKAERDAEAYLGKIGWRRRVAWLRERFIFSENHGMRLAAALGVLVMALVPILMSEGEGGVQTAMFETESAVADGAGRASEDDVADFGAGAAVSVAGKADSAVQSEDEGRGEPRLATATGPVLADDEVPAGAGMPPIPVESEALEKIANGDPGERVASRATAIDAAADQAVTAAAPEVDATALQIEILSARLKQSKTPEEKLVILRGLRALYKQAGKTAKVVEVDRQIKALK